MENSGARKWQIRGVVFAIFLLGFLAGALSLHLYRGRRGPNSPGDRRDRLEQMVTRLNLTPEQKTQVDKLMEETRHRTIGIRRQSGAQFGEVRREMDERLRAILTPEQWQQWQEMTKGMRERRGRGRPQ
jgi:Spy/CpxP family protein refolding chaperone